MVKLKNISTSKRYIIVIILFFLMVTNPGLDEHSRAYSFDRSITPTDEGIWIDRESNDDDNYIVMRRVNFYLFSVSRVNRYSKNKKSIKTIGVAGFVIVL